MGGFGTGLLGFGRAVAPVARGMGSVFGTPGATGLLGLGVGQALARAKATGEGSARMKRKKKPVSAAIDSALGKTTGVGY